MRSVRKGVFETNSSSSHSISISYITTGQLLNRTSCPLYHNLESNVVDINVLDWKLKQDGEAVGEMDKLRVIVSLITDLIKDEYTEKLKKEWKVKNNTNIIGYDFWEFYWKRLKGKMAKRYVYEHKYWKYLNSALEDKKNIHISLYDTLDYFPYISESVDYGQGAEYEPYYYGVGIKPNMTKDAFKKKVTELIFDPSIIFYQSCFRND